MRPTVFYIQMISFTLQIDLRKYGFRIEFLK